MRTTRQAVSDAILPFYRLGAILHMLNLLAAPAVTNEKSVINISEFDKSTDLRMQLTHKIIYICIYIHQNSERCSWLRRPLEPARRQSAVINPFFVWRAACFRAAVHSKEEGCRRVVLLADLQCEL